AITAFRFELPPPGATAEEVARRLLGPVREEIAAAARVHIFACDALRAVDFHALPFGEGALIDHAVVTYGTDLSGPPRHDAGHHARRALLVADPSDNLAATVDEAGQVERGIAMAQGWETLSLLRDKATSVRVREALAGASW